MKEKIYIVKEHICSGESEFTAAGKARIDVEDILYDWKAKDIKIKIKKNSRRFSANFLDTSVRRMFYSILQSIVYTLLEFHPAKPSTQCLPKTYVTKFLIHLFLFRKRQKPSLHVL